jgi:hypothetical protein
VRFVSSAIIIPFDKNSILFSYSMTAKDNSMKSPLLDGNGQQPTEPSDTNEQQQQQQLPPDYISSTIQENEQSDHDDDDDDEDDDDEQSSTQTDDIDIYDENGQIKFPLNDLIKLEEQLNQTRWVVPVLPDGELIKCLRASVRLAAQSKYLKKTKNFFVMFVFRIRYKK